MSRNFGAGSFGRGPNVYEQSQSEFDVDARRSLDGFGPKTQLTAAQVKQAYQEAVSADEKRTVSMQNADAFILLNPHILDTTKNAQLINKMVKNLFGDVAHTIEQYQTAIDALLVANADLDIDQAEVAKQQQKATDAKRKAALKSRADAEARVFNPNTDYADLSLEELRQRSNEELRSQEGAAGF